MITGDRGLAGAFNSNVIRMAASSFRTTADAEVQLELIGRKGRDFFRKRHRQALRASTSTFSKGPAYEDAVEIAGKVIERFKKAEIDSVYLVVNKFKSMMASKCECREDSAAWNLPEKRTNRSTTFTSNRRKLLDACCRATSRAQIYRAMLESSAAEHAARMTAMEAASSNAAEVIEALTLNMNRVRQAASREKSSKL